MAIWCVVSKSWDLLRKRMNEKLAPHGAVSEFCRVTGFSRQGVDKWLGGETIPSMDKIDKIAEALGLQPWELIKPQGADSLVPDIKREFIQEILQLDDVTSAKLIPGFRTLIDGAQGRLKGKDPGKNVK